MAALSAAGTHCKFEASDGASDEVVLLKILDVLRNALTGRLGGVLSDESVCEMMETGLSMCCQMRLSEMLRRSAERTMQAMVSAVFSRLRSLPDDAGLPAFASSAASATDSVSHQDDHAGLGLRMAAPNPRSANIPAAEDKQNGELAAEQGGYDPARDPVPAHDRFEFEAAGLPAEEVVDDDEAEPSPFGLASIQELLRVLISLLNPHDQQHTDSMRLMALGLLNIAFEVAGRSIGRFPALRAMVADQLCKHLFQLARSDNLQLLSTSLRVITNIFDTMREHLRLQQELFLSFLLDRLVQPLPSTAPGTRKAEVEAALDQATWGAGERDPGVVTGKERERWERERERTGREAAEARELMLDILGHFARGEYDMADLWVNYDCNVEGEDLAERLIKFFSRGVFPSPFGVAYIQDNTQLGCLDTVLGLVASMANRLDQPPPPPTHSGPTAAEVAKAKADKKVLLEGAAQWNVKPKVGLKFLEDHGIIGSGSGLSRDESIAHFLKTTPRLDKKQLGDWISRGEQIEVLRAFMRSMDFSGRIICDAMRELLEAFRLPGESQQINRITETFAEVYFATGPAEVKTSDAVYVLAYSVIMLNTDQHSSQVRKRMDFEAYARNLRGVNDGADFSQDYLHSVFDSIRKREIIFPEEHQNALGFEYGWKELLRRARRSAPFAANQTNQFDRAMFELTWKPVVSALSFAFANFQDDYMVQRAIGGFNQCATLAARFDMPQVFDFLILSLSKVTGLTQASAAIPAELANFPIVDIEGQKVTVSPLAVRFGMNVKAQLAAVVLFTIANNNGASIRDGWAHIFEIYQTLFVHSLLPQSLLAMEGFLSGDGLIPLKPAQAPQPRDDRRNDGGLLSTLSSYLLSPYGGATDLSANDFSDDDVETTLSAVDCIASCCVEDLYAHIFDLKGDALVAPVTILIDLTQKMTIDRLRGKPNTGAAHNFSHSPQSQPQPQISITTARHQLAYDPSAVLLLEVLTSVVSRADDKALLELWPATFDFLTRLVSAANSFSSLLNERVVASLLKLAVVVVKQDDLRDSTFLALDMLRGLSPAVLGSVAEPLMTGLSRLFIENADRIHSETEWNLIFALFQATIHQEEAARLSFELIKQLAAGQLGAGLVPDNYAAFLHVLSAFANVAAGPAEEPALQRGRQIVDILRDTQTAIPALIAQSSLSAPRAWEASWVPLLSAYAQLCLSPARELRQTAISSLQRTLLAPEILHSEMVDLTVIFEKVFFPMLDELLKPQVFRRDAEGMGETRLRASALLCKIFLQYLVQLSESVGMRRMRELWIKILGYQDRFMHSGRRDQMFEAVPEALKNVLLVMNASGFLVPPFIEGRSLDQQLLWDQTFERISPFLPELERELFPKPRQVVPVPFEDMQQPKRREASGQPGPGPGQAQAGGAGSPVVGQQIQEEQYQV